MAGSQQLLLGEGAGGAEKNYIEDVFSTYLYTGNDSTQTITNGIDLATKGGMVWLKYRSGSASTTYHHVYDSARGKSGNTSYNYLYTNTTSPQGTGAYGPTSFNTDGFSLNSYLNESTIPYVGWTFRKQPKFFDAVAYSGNGTTQNIAHNLGSTPGCVIVKRTDSAGDWMIWHRGLPNGYYIRFTTSVQQNAFNDAYFGNGTTYVNPTSTVFTVGYGDLVNNASGTYVAYLFAHDAGGFGLTGTDNVISCGSFTGLATVNLGWEPQWILYKTSGSANSGWLMVDNMRGFTSGDADPYLEANSSAAETGGNDLLTINSTGFKNNLFSGDTFIYIAIRRGPMKVPTDATKVFSPVAYSGTNTAGQVISGVGFSPDLSIPKYRAGGGGGAVAQFIDRLRGGTAYLAPSSTGAEGNTGGYYIRSFDMDGATFGTAYVDYTYSGNTYVDWFFKRAPSFFDEVCYTGTGSATTFNHNLGVVPELMIFKARSVAGSNWAVYSSALGNTQSLFLNLTNTPTTASSIWNNTNPTSSVFTVGTAGAVNTSGTTYVAYLFSSCNGVSKVGSYTGTGTTKQVDCGFAAGARFVLIKRTDSTGDWYVWDSARGIVAGNDPYLLLNSTAAEVTSTDYVDTYAAGFELSSTAPAALNASGGTYIFLAIA